MSIHGRESWYWYPPSLENAVQKVSWWSMVLKNRSVLARHDISCDCGWWPLMKEWVLNLKICWIEGEVCVDVVYDGVAMMMCQLIWYGMIPARWFDWENRCVCRGVSSRGWYSNYCWRNVITSTGDKTDRYCNVLPPNELHSGLKYHKVRNTYKKSYPSRVRRYGTKNSMSVAGPHVSTCKQKFTLRIFCYTYIHRNSIVQQNIRRRIWYSLHTFWVCVVVVSWCRIDMGEIEQNVMALRNQNCWRMKYSWRYGVDKAESLLHTEF